MSSAAGNEAGPKAAGDNAADRSAQLLASIVESSDDAIVSKDLNGVILSWNRGAERLFGYTAEEVIGKPITIIIPDDHQDEEPVILGRIRRGERIEHFDTIRQRKDGSLLEISLTISPVRDASGRIVAASKIARDISERKRSEALLSRRIEEQAALYQFTDRLYRSDSLGEVCDAALDAILRALRCERASILLSDTAGVMRFVAWRGLSDDYRKAVEGHSPWAPGTPDPQPIFVDNIERADEPEELKATVRAEGICGLAFIPLVASGRLIGKFMTYYGEEHSFTREETDLALTIARQLGFSIETIRTEELRDEAEMALRNERELLQTIFGRIPVMLTMYEPNSNVLRVNPEFERVVGWSTRDAAGISLMEECYPDPAYRAEVSEFMQSARDGWMDVRMRTRDGRDIDTSWANIRLSGGTHIGIGIDITDRKRGEKLQQLLIGELNHRVKNTLATVQSIANQTVRTARSPAEFVASFSGRLQALARTHTLLTQGTWQGADVLRLVRDQLLLGGAEDERISCFGSSMTLPPQTALHLALVLHELGTNARKHGALSVPQGRLSVSWGVQKNGERKFALEWKERGGPKVATPTSPGFGTTLIEQSLHAQGGDISVRYEPQGVSCLIKVPLAEDSETGFLPPKVFSSDTLLSNSRWHGRPSNGVQGTRVLVVEDEPLVAMDVISILTSAGCEVVGPAGSIEKAKALIANNQFDVALLDANLGGRPVGDIASSIAERQVPFAFLTGYGREGLPAGFERAELIGKPFTGQQVVDTVSRLLEEPFHSVAEGQQSGAHASGGE